MGIGDEHMALRPSSTISYFKDKKDVAEYVRDMLMNFKPGLPLTTIITRARYEDFYAVTAITESSAAIVNPLYSETQQFILSKDTPDGSSQ